MKRYYPWFMAIMGLLILMISNGLTITGLSAFDEALLGEFGWERGPFKFRDKSYQVAFTLMCALVLVALVASTLVRNEREHLAGR